MRPVVTTDALEPAPWTAFRKRCSSFENYLCRRSYELKVEATGLPGLRCRPVLVFIGFCFESFEWCDMQLGGSVCFVTYSVPCFV